MSHRAADTPRETDTSLEVNKPKNWATGAPAVKKSLEHVYSAAGVARGTEALLKLNKKSGFDCPSCAWPDPDGHRAAAEFCENGAKATASETTRKVIDREFFETYSVTELLEKSDHWYEQQGRLAEPFVLHEGSDHFQPLSWSKAFDLISDELKALPSPDDAIFYTSGRTSNEAAFLYQLMVRHYGTNNLPDCSNMCHESSGAALNETVGVGKGTTSLDDIYEAETILCVGQNPGTNHPRMLSALEKTVQNGGKVIAINPLKEAGLQAFANPQKPRGLLNISKKIASQYLQVKPAGDQALFRALAKRVLEWDDSRGGIVDHQFIAEHTSGFDDYVERVKQDSFDSLSEQCGIDLQEIDALAETIVRDEKKLITCWAMGVTQQENAVATIQEIVNLHLLLGAVGKDGCGLCPVRGHSNVQGDRTMGIWEKMSAEFHDNIDEEFAFASPRKHGFDTVMAIKAMHEEPGKVFFAMGGNFLQASPDTHYTGRALQNCRLTAHVGTKLNRGHLITGRTGLILPCLGRADRDRGANGDQFITTENSMGIVQKSQGSLEPVSRRLKSEPEIVAGIADKLIGDTKTVRWTWLAEDYDRIRNLIERVIPGFDQFNDRVREPGGFYLPNSAKERIWDTDTKKANFTASDVSTFSVPQGHLILQTLRSHDQYNTTVYGMDDRYRGIGHARRIIFLNPTDMEKRDIKPMTLIDVTSHYAGQERLARGFQAIPYDLPSGSAAAYFPEANVLVPVDQTAKISNTPCSKGIDITVRAAGEN